MSLIHNERTKLTANWFNAISAASVAVGAFAQLAPFVVGTTPASGLAVAGFSLAWLAGGGGLHVVARWLLGRLRE